MVTTGRVVAVGAIHVDWIVEVPRLPSAGETVVGGQVRRRHGGKGANQAVAAAYAGASVIMVGAVGNDAFADEALASLEEGGVEHAQTLKLEDLSTGVAMIAVDTAGENQIVVTPGAGAQLTAAHISAALAAVAIGPTDVVLVSNELPAEAVTAAVLDSHQVGARVVLNPAPATHLSPRVLAAATVITPNASEVKSLAGGDDVLSAARSLHERTGAAVVVTQGPAGATVVDSVAEDHFGAPACEPLDTVGAGDFFNGTLAARLLAGDTLRAATQAAVAAASESTQWIGSRPPRRS